MSSGHKTPEEKVWGCKEHSRVGRPGALEAGSSDFLANKSFNFNHFRAHGHGITCVKPVAMTIKCFMVMKIPGKSSMKKCKHGANQKGGSTVGAKLLGWSRRTRV